MTTAAPPEKMITVELREDELQLVLDYHDNEDAAAEAMECFGTIHAARARALREAARRLALRVGDDVREALLLYVKWGTLHENSECPEDDTCTCYVARTVNAALSAPPVASAERSELEQLIVDMGMWVSPEQYAKRILAAGYRKRAGDGR